MPRFATENTEALGKAVAQYLRAFPGELTCALQIWYEALGGYGAPTPADMDALHACLDGAAGWKSVGSVRYEKYGAQPSYQKTL